MHDKKMPHFIVSYLSHMAILILVFITLTATVCCVADWGGDFSLIASMLPTGW